MEAQLKMRQHARDQVKLFCRKQERAERLLARARSRKPRTCCLYTNPDIDHYIEDGCPNCTKLHCEYKIGIWGKILNELGKFSLLVLIIYIKILF